MKKVIVFVSYHNWRTKRLGGFHMFAEACCESGNDVCFISFPRPWYGVFKNNERVNLKKIVQLSKGCLFEICKARLINFTVPTFALPNPIRRLFPEKMNYKLDRLTLPSLVKRCKKKFSHVDAIVFESAYGLVLLEEFQKAYPLAKIIYRPSDPIAANPDSPKGMVELELLIMKRASLTLMVNEESVEKYKSRFGNEMSMVNYQILPNGVDLKKFQMDYETPYVFKEGKPIALYVGALSPDWDLILRAAKEMVDIQFFIICPEKPKKTILDEVAKSNNLTYIAGVFPEEVPAYIVNCSIMIVPYPSDKWKHLPWGLHAKLLQGMAAKKPIVGINLDPELKYYEIGVAENFCEFVNLIQENINIKSKHYKFNIFDRDWRVIKNKFLSCLDEIDSLPNMSDCQ